VAERYTEPDLNVLAGDADLFDEQSERLWTWQVVEGPARCVRRQRWRV
jgi:hypothetical protein